MKTISAKIPDSEYLELERLARVTPGGKSAVVRIAVQEHCRKQALDQKEAEAIIDRAFGAFKDAPLDAAEHRKSVSGRLL